MTLSLRYSRGVQIALWLGCAGVVGAIPQGLQAQTSSDTYVVRGADILKNDVPTVWGGTNAFFIYGGSSSTMSAWNIGMVREPLSDLSETPVAGAVARGSDGSYLHSMQDVVDDNRTNGKITILCPFQWAPGTGQFAGQVPSKEPYYVAYKQKMQQIAAQFIDQPDVWIELWNEPYPDTNDPLWLHDMKDMVDNIRGAGNNNIVLVPGSDFDSSEDVILSHGSQLLEGRANVVFDIHGYAWEPNTQQSTEQRILAIRKKGFALMFAETGPGTSSGVVNPTNFLKAVLHQEVTTLVWYWNFNTTDPNSLFTSTGAPNNTNNYNWSTTAQSFLTWIGGSGDIFLADRAPGVKSGGDL